MVFFKGGRGSFCVHKISLVKNGLFFFFFFFFLLIVVCLFVLSGVWLEEEEKKPLIHFDLIAFFYCCIHKEHKKEVFVRQKPGITFIFVIFWVVVFWLFWRRAQERALMYLCFSSYVGSVG